MGDRWDQYIEKPEKKDWSQYAEKPSGWGSDPNLKLPSFGEMMASPDTLAPRPDNPYGQGTIGGIMSGGSRIANAKSTDDVLGGVSDVARGVGLGVSPYFMPAATASLPAFLGAATTMGAGALGQMGGEDVARGQGAGPGTTQFVGDVTGAVTGGLLGRGLKAGSDWLTARRTPNPDLTFQNAITVNPSDSDFADKVPSIRGWIKRGSDLIGKKATDVKSTLESLKAAQDELMSALEDHKAVARKDGKMMSVDDLKAKQKAAIPEGLRDEDPDGYDAIVKAIDAQFPNKTHLNVDDVFTQLQLNNARRSAFFSGREASQNAKLMTNAGDAGVLKAAGSAYRDWIAENVGETAAALNRDWGNLKAAKGYLKAKIPAAVRELPITPLEGDLDAAGVDLGAQNPMHGVARGVGKKIIGRPQGIDELLRSTFENTQATTAPLRPNTAPLPLGGLLGPAPTPALPQRAVGLLSSPPSQRLAQATLLSQLQGARPSGGPQQQASAPGLSIPGQVAAQAAPVAQLKGPDATPTGRYQTALTPQQEAQFQTWVKKTKAPWEDVPTADYDMRGFYKALQAGDPRATQAISKFDGKPHYPDIWKTPFHKTMSRESIYAPPGAPHWEGHRLIDKSGRVIADETPEDGVTGGLLY